MTEPHAQDEQTYAGHGDDDPVVPPAPANQWTPHDGGIEPAAPSPMSSRRAVGRMMSWLRRGLPGGHGRAT
ncbi:MAG: hypothetical protein ACR2LQ_02925 [Acidimicrobiales bacterium]